MPVENLKKLFPNPTQPRRHFSQKELEQLANSIKENGLLEPIVTTPRNNMLMIIAGERRWRACKMAGLEKVEVLIIEADDKKVAELAMLENIQREDLNLIEEAHGYENLLEMDLSIDEIAKKMGFKQPWRIRDRLSLLKMHPRYQGYLVNKIISPTQAYELSRLNHEKQHVLYRKIKEGRADTTQRLRAIANALLIPPPVQEVIGGELDEKEKKISKKYDKLLERLLNFIDRSLDKDDLSVLKKVINSSVEVNIKRIEMIIAELKKIKTAMVEAQTKKDALIR